MIGLLLALGLLAAASVVAWLLLERSLRSAEAGRYGSFDSPLIAEGGEEPDHTSEDAYTPRHRYLFRGRATFR